MSSLESLPAEVLCEILSYTSPFNPRQRHYPLYTIAATSKELNGICEGYARSLLRIHARLSPKSTAGQRYRKLWRKWVLTNCQDCGKKSRRRAILSPEVTLCHTCDKKIPKMTMTTATQSHYLSKLDLFTPNMLHPDLPPLSFGQYACMGNDTTMILEADIMARKQQITKLLRMGSTPGHTLILKRRVAAHDRIIEASDITFRHGEWMRAGRFFPAGGVHANARIKAWRTIEGRQSYVSEHLKKQREALGYTGDGHLRMLRQTIGITGNKKEDPIDLE